MYFNINSSKCAFSQDRGPIMDTYHTSPLGNHKASSKDCGTCFPSTLRPKHHMLMTDSLHYTKVKVISMNTRLVISC